MANDAVNEQLVAHLQSLQFVTISGRVWAHNAELFFEFGMNNESRRYILRSINTLMLGEWFSFCGGETAQQNQYYI